MTCPVCASGDYCPDDMGLPLTNDTEADAEYRAHQARLRAEALHPSRYQPPNQQQGE